MKVRNTLIIITAVLLIVTTTAFGIFLGIQLDSTADEMYETYLSELSKGQAENLGTYLAELTSRLKTITALPEVQDYTSGKTSQRKDDVEKLLKALTDTDTVTSAIIYDSDGKILIGSGINETETLADGVCDVNAKDYTPVTTNPAIQFPCVQK